MFNPAGDLSVLSAVILIGIVTALGFAVSWITTDLLDVKRTPYIAVLTGATVVATALVVWIGDFPLGPLFTENWEMGVIAGIVAGVIGGVGIRKFPATLRRSGRQLMQAEAWEGVVYGIAEGLLLSALPVAVISAAGEDAGWATATTWFAALAASAVVIAIHHFGYWDFRNRHVLEALGGCLMLSLACLISGSVLAAVVGHIVLHAAGIVKGIELPPRPHPIAGAV